MSYLKMALAGAVLVSGLAQAAGNPNAGRVKSEACLGCHAVSSYNNVYPTYHVPRIAGQNADYIVAALQAYRDGQRKHATMNIQAQSMSDEDMADIGAFWQAQGQ
jgi:cytochrome c553